MGWSAGAYYRSVRSGGTVRRVYVGKGLVGELAEAKDQAARAERARRRQAEDGERAAREAIEGAVRQADGLAELLARAALVATGHHQHHRGGWRKRRGRATKG